MRGRRRRSRGGLPAPVVEHETAKERFWRRYEPRQAAAAARLGDEAVAKRASLSGGLPRAMAIAQEYGTDGNDDPGTQTDLTARGTRTPRTGPGTARWQNGRPDRVSYRRL